MKEWEKELFELLPFKTKETTERICQICKNHKVNPYYENEDGVMFLHEAVERQRYDLLLYLRGGVREVYSGNEEQDHEWFRALKAAVENGNNQLVEELLKKNALKCAPEEMKRALYINLVSMKKMYYVDCIVKREKVLEAAIIPEPGSYADRQFLKAALRKYAGKLVMGNENEASRMMKLAVLCDDQKLVKTILKKQDSYAGLEYLVGGSDDMFKLFLKMSGKIKEEDRPEILMYAYMAPEGEERLDKLIKKRSWKLTFRDEKGADVVDLMEEKIENLRYPNNKSGYLVKQTYQKKLRKLHKKLELARTN